MARPRFQRNRDAREKSLTPTALGRLSPHKPTSRLGTKQDILELLKLEDNAIVIAPSRLRRREALSRFLATCLRCANGFSTGEGVIMSGVNGDKARFNRVRRQKLARRIRNRKLFKKIVTPARPVAATRKPVGT